MKRRKRTAARQATAARKATAAHNSTATPCTVNTGETCTDEGTDTSMLSESPDVKTGPDEAVQTDPDEEMLIALSEHLLQLEAELSTTREELESRSNELSHVKSELQTENDQLAEVKAELAEEKKVNAHLRSENSSLSKRVVSEQTLSNNDKMVKYYTGLPSFDLLKAIYELTIADVPTNLFSGYSCSPLQQLIIVLMKLRFNLGDQDLAYRFGINQSTVSRYFNKWLDILYHKLSIFVSC